MGLVHLAVQDALAPEDEAGGIAEGALDPFPGELPGGGGHTSDVVRVGRSSVVESDDRFPGNTDTIRRQKTLIAKPAARTPPTTAWKMKLPAPGSTYAPADGSPTLRHASTTIVTTKIRSRFPIT